MALRCLLRRIPVRLPSGPVMGPVHGTSPATAAGAPRFLATQTEGVKKILELQERAARLQKERNACIEEARKAQENTDKLLAEMEKNVRLYLDKMNRYTRYFIIVGYTTAAALLASAMASDVWGS